MVPVVFVVLLWLTFRPSWAAVALSGASLLLAVVAVFTPFEGIARLIGARRDGSRILLAVLGPCIGSRISGRMRWRWGWRARYYSILIVDDAVAGQSAVTQYVSELRWAFAGTIARALVALGFGVLAWRARDVAVLPLLFVGVLLVRCLQHVARVAAIVS
jgi:hypothetical protein